jgi:surfeit locus 1 family protein
MTNAGDAARPHHGEERPEGSRLEPRNFPLGLTLAAAIVFAICVALGAWQLQRLTWKTHELARIAALKSAPARPLAPVLAKAATGADVSFTRVAADCLPASPAPAVLRMVTDNSEWIARVTGACLIAGAPFDGVVVDRGFLAASRGSPNPPAVTLPAPLHVVGVLYARPPGAAPGLSHPAPYTLVAEAETPPAPGVAPAPYADPAGNLEYVGAYAPTWFGLAGVLACVYAAMLWRRYHPKPPKR